VEKQQRCRAWKVKIFTAASGPKKGRVYPGIDHVVNDKVAAARETLQKPTSGKEASSWAK
jgi:hypothetical protein